LPKARKRKLNYVNPAEFSEEGYGSKRAVLSMMMMVMGNNTLYM
jgi:hypothetical protein